MLILPLFSRETVSLFLHFTVNPKPPVGFLDVPRCSMTGKEQTVCRWHSQSWDQVTFSKLRSSIQPESFLSWQWKFSRVTLPLVRFQQIESRWGYSGTSDKIRLIFYLGPLVSIFLLPGSLWIGGFSWSALVSMALFMDPQSNNDTENINCWQFLLAGMT